MAAAVILKGLMQLAIGIDKNNGHAMLLLVF